jgi:hypothetical protein
MYEICITYNPYKPLWRIIWTWWITAYRELELGILIRHPVIFINAIAAISALLNFTHKRIYMGSRIIECVTGLSFLLDMLSLRQRWRRVADRILAVHSKTRDCGVERKAGSSTELEKYSILQNCSYNFDVLGQLKSFHSSELNMVIMNLEDPDD